MKKVFLFILFSVFCLSFSLALAEENLEVNIITKEVRPVNNDWRNLGPTEIEAYKNPNQEIAINVDTTFKKSGFFHYTTIKDYKQIVVFKNDKLKIIDKNGREYGKKQLALYIIFLLLAIFFMFIINVIKNKKKYRIVITITFVVAAATGVVAAANAVTTFGTGAALVAFAAIGIAAIATIENSIDAYRILSGIFYIAAIIGIFIF